MEFEIKFLEQTNLTLLTNLIPIEQFNKLFYLHLSDYQVITNYPALVQLPSILRRRCLFLSWTVCTVKFPLVFTVTKKCV